MMMEGRLLQNYEPLWDIRSEACARAAAIRGSTRLRRAIERLQQTRRRRSADFRPRTWEARKANMKKVRELQAVVADHFNTTVEALNGPRGPADLCRIRMIAMYLARTETLASYPDIGRCFGSRDHTTVIHAFREVERSIDRDVLELRKKLAA